MAPERRQRSGRAARVYAEQAGKLLSQVVADDSVDPTETARNILLAANAAATLAVYYGQEAL